jgi:quinolinate synthase
MSQSREEIKQQILALKKSKNVALFAHYYQEGDIQEIADEVGDSFHLAKVGQIRPENNILLAGVVFMAESIKILNPQKTVLVPDLKAGCSLVESSPYNDFLNWRRKFPTGVCVTYINSSAEVKSISDVIITSSNAEKIINSIPLDRPVLFGPDKNLGHYLSKKLNRQFELWPGVCQVHVLFSVERLKKLMAEHPDALVIAHPECEEEILMLSEVIGSTSKLLETVGSSEYSKFIVATETGIFHQMKKLRPDAKILQAPAFDESCLCNDCPFMKMNSLEKILNALKTFKPEVSLPEPLRVQAQLPLQRMLDIAAGKPVSFPALFSM